MTSELQRSWKNISCNPALFCDINRTRITKFYCMLLWEAHMAKDPTLLLKQVTTSLTTGSTCMRPTVLHLKTTTSVQYFKRNGKLQVHGADPGMLDTLRCFHMWGYNATKIKGCPGIGWHRTCSSFVGWSVAMLKNWHRKGFCRTAVIGLTQFPNYCRSPDLLGELGRACFLSLSSWPKPSLCRFVALFWGN